MRNYRFAFHITGKRRTYDLATALSLGAGHYGDAVEIIDHQQHMEPAFDGGACMGMTHKCRRLYEEYRAAGKFFLLFDKGYMDRWVYWRISVNAWQPLRYFQRFKHSGDRLDTVIAQGRFFLNTSHNHRQPPKGVILVAGVCQSHCNFHGLGNVNDYHEQLIRQIREHTSRVIIYRPNPSWFTKHNDEYREIRGVKNLYLSPPTERFDDVLMRAHCLVTHGSSAALGAMAQAVPVMVMGEGIAAPMGIPKLSMIDDPYYPDPKRRIQFFSDVAYTQWSRAEYISGAAWSHLKPILSSFDGVQDEPTLDEIIGQYKMLHQSPKYFRGIRTGNYAEEIGKLVATTQSATILDYGSGKGVQYERPRFLQQRWNVTVKCYDPGVPGFDELPSGTFDGVICCDVMEHIPEPHVKETLERIIRYANRFVFFAIAVQPAQKVLPDGRNCHLTVRPAEWWHEAIAAAQVAVGRKVLTKVIISHEVEDIVKAEEAAEELLQ